VPLWLWLIVDGLAVYRLARLITADSLTRPVRLAVLRRWPPRVDSPRPSELAVCAWCISPYLGVAAYTATRYLPSIWIWIAVPLAFSAIAGYLSERA
jgi:hypothetical protein